MLVIDISINRSQLVEEIGIVRISGGTNPDDINEYEFGFIVDGRISEVLGRIKHRYGDSGLKLSSMVLGILNDQDPDGVLASKRRGREAGKFYKLFEKLR